MQSILLSQVAFAQRGYEAYDPLKGGGTRGNNEIGFGYCLGKAMVPPSSLGARRVRAGPGIVSANR